MSKAKTDAFASVWDAIADTPEEGANLRVRSDLMSKLAAIVEEHRWTQTEAANHCGVTQPRINDLLRGRLSRFSLDALVNIAAALGQRVHVELDAARDLSGSKKMATAMRQAPRQRAAPRRTREAGSRVAARTAAEKKRAADSR